MTPKLIDDGATSTPSLNLVVTISKKKMNKNAGILRKYGKSLFLIYDWNTTKNVLLITCCYANKTNYQ